MVMMSEDELLSRVQTLARGYSINREDGEVSNIRKRLQRYHDGKPYGDEKRGRSKVVTREVFQTVRWSLPWIVRNCMTGRPVVFSPENADDVQAAEEETDVAFWAMRSAENSFNELLSFAYGNLLMPNSYIKVWWDEAPQYQIGRIYGKADIELAMVQEDPNAELIMVAPAAEGGGMLYDAVVRYAYTNPRIKMQALPYEEVLVAADATDINLDTVPWVCHHRKMVESELVALGYPVELVDSLPSAEIWNWRSETQTRKNTEDELRIPPVPLPGTEQKDVYDWCGFVDFDGDGIAERRFVRFSRDELLENDYTDYQPIVCSASLPQPHRHVGISQAENALQWQRVSSELSRQGLNNLYRVNQPRAIIGRDARVNLEQFRQVLPDGYIEADDVTGLQWERVPPIFGQVQAGQAFVAEQMAAETGVNKLATGLDANLLAKSTMGAYLEASGQASAVLELVVRCFAENGMAGIATKVHHLLRTRSSGEMMAEVAGQSVPVSPSSWARRTRMQAQVGTGTGSLGEKISAGMAVMDFQREALPAGMTTPDRIYNSVQDLMQLLGKPSAARYFLDPQSEEYQVRQQQRAQAEAEAQARQEQAVQAQVMLALRRLGIDEGKLQVSAAQAASKAATDADKQALAWAELEAEQGVDVVDRGLMRPDMKPRMLDG